MRLRRAETDVATEPDETPAEAIVRQHWPRWAAFTWPHGLAGAPRAHAEVEHGRWIVRCPICRVGAQMASDTDRRFYCVHCQHAGTEAQGRWLTVDWPADADLIEEALLRRAHGRNQNWRPGETPEALNAETAEQVAREGLWDATLALRAGELPLRDFLILEAPILGRPIPAGDLERLEAPDRAGAIAEVKRLGVR